MNGKKKENSVLTHEFNEATNVVTFNVLGAGTLMLDVSALSTNIRQKAMLHGLIQKISDGAALTRDKETGALPTPVDKLTRMTAIRDSLLDGEWMRKRGTAGPRDTSAIVWTALGRVTGKLEADLRDMVADLARKAGTDEKAALAKLAATERVATEIGRIKAERAKSAGVDGDELLAGLMGEESDEPGDAPY